MALKGKKKGEIAISSSYETVDKAYQYQLHLSLSLSLSLSDKAAQLAHHVFKESSWPYQQHPDISTTINPAPHCLADF